MGYLNKCYLFIHTFREEKALFFLFSKLHYINLYETQRTVISQRTFRKFNLLQFCYFPFR